MSSIEGDSQVKDCGLCIQEGSKKEARHFCENCQSYICDSCNDSHKKFQDLKSHIITPHKSKQHDASTVPVVTSRLSHLSTQPSESINAHDEPSVPEELPKVDAMSGKPSPAMSETETSPVARADEPFDSSKSESPKEIHALKEAKFTLAAKVNIKGESEERQPNIGGCCFMPGGELLLCDFWGHNVKLLDSNFSLKGSIENFKWGPTDAAALDNVTAVVTVKEHVQLITISPSLQMGLAISVGKNCYGIDVAANQIYVCCYTPGKENGEIRIYDSELNLQKKIGKKTFSYLFALPKYVSVSRYGEIFVLDGRTVKCLTKDGKVDFQFSGLSLPTPDGIFADGNGDVIVCNRHSYTIVLITKKGREYRTLLSLPDKPQCVTYRPTDGTLAIGCADSDHLLIYKAS